MGKELLCHTCHTGTPATKQGEEKEFPDSAELMTHHPPPVTPHSPNELRLVFWETTAGCNLECIHCRRLDVAKEMMKDDLSTQEAMQLIEQIADISRPILVLSGGEPLIRSDIFDIASYACQRGLTVSLATNGTMISEEVALKIKEAGISRCAVSLDGADAKTHDTFRRQVGSFKKAIEGIQNLRRIGLEVQINTTIAKHNDGQLKAIYELARELGCVALHSFMLVPVGCGISVADQEMLSVERYEEVLNEFYDLSRLGELHLKATCAPHYYRIIRQRAKFERSGAKPTVSYRPSVSPFVKGAMKNGSGMTAMTATTAMTAMTKGCLAGTAVCFVSHKGEVFPCGYLPVEAGNVRRQSFGQIWEHSPIFQTLRRPELLGGKCGVCEYRIVCMGCRARAYYATGDFMSEEPFCIYQPRSIERRFTFHGKSY